MRRLALRRQGINIYVKFARVGRRARSTHAGVEAASARGRTSDPEPMIMFFRFSTAALQAI
jgi:hypothetical protein